MSTKDTASQIVSGLLQIATFARSRQWQTGQALDLTPTQIGILRVLADRGPTQISKVGRFLSVTQATESDAISALETKGLVERKPDPQDARARLAHLTREGRCPLSVAGDGKAPSEFVEAPPQIPEARRRMAPSGGGRIIRACQNLDQLAAKAGREPRAAPENCVVSPAFD